MTNLADDIKSDALEAQKFSRKHLVLELDFSARSIADIEEHVDGLDYSIPGGTSSENIEMLTRVWGAYLGESLRKQVGGEWAADANGRVGLQGANRTLYPHDQVRRRLTDGSQHNLSTYFEQAASEL